MLGIVQEPHMKIHIFAIIWYNKSFFVVNVDFLLFPCINKKHTMPILCFII